MTYVLPDFSYDYDALVSRIAPETMEPHHNKHHATYVAGANTVLEQLAETRESGNFSGINELERDLVFHLGGYINHSAFWKDMSPEGGGRPDDEPVAAIDEYFGGFDGFQEQLNAVTNGIQDPGWSMLVFDTLGRCLNINQLYDQ